MEAVWGVVEKEGDFGRVLVVRCVDFGSENAPYPRAGCLFGAIPEPDSGFKIVGVKCDSALVGEGRLKGRFCGRRLVPKNPCRYGEVCFCEKLRFRNGQNVFGVRATTIGGRLSEKG